MTRSRVFAACSVGRLLTLCLALLVSTPGWSKVWTIAASDQLEHDAQEALLLAEPGDTVLLPAGRFSMSVELSMTKPYVTLKGQGMDQTTLVYGENAAGPQAIIASADYSTVEDLGILDHPGDGVKMIGIKGATMRRVKVEWSKHGAAENGAYGLYPVQSSQVLIEDCYVIGASDAGVYVGQSNQIVVRRNRAEYNVAGIEIENSQHADVYQNVVTKNTGGVLVFNLPNLLVQGGRGTRIFNNSIFENNFRNFAPKGNSVSTVPQGTGVLVLANDDVEIFSNTIEGHNTTSIAIVSFYALGRAIEDPAFDAVPENISIHDNKLRNAGRWPLIGGNELGIAAAALSFPHRVPHITYDGIGFPSVAGGEPGAAKLEGFKRICIGANDQDGGGKSYFGNMQLWKKKWYSPLPGEIDRSLVNHHCDLPRLTPVTLDAPPPAPTAAPGPSADEIATLCSGAPDDGSINWEALSVDCPSLSDYRLFKNRFDPLTGPNEGGLPYDLTTPLFSDYASKDRVIFLPRGSSAAYKAQGVFDLPVGTVVAKSFYFPTDLRRPDGPKKLVETRLLIHRENGWQGLTYLWKDKEASLTRGGAVVPVNWIDAAGKSQAQAYRVPNLAQCSGCHLNTVPIGLQAGYLNKEGHGLLSGQNQLEGFALHGALSGLPAQLSDVPRFPVWNKASSGTLAERAKTYLDINCAHCHSVQGKGSTSGLFLNLSQAQNINYGICKPPIAAGRGAGGTLLDIVPGKPQDSILVHRLNSTKAAIKMPELAKSLVHKEGVELIEAWISSLEGGCAK